MNIRGIANRAIQIVNPNITILWRKSLGYEVDEDGIQIPVYSDPVQVIAQVQSLSVSEIQAYEGLNLSTSSRKVYLKEYPNAVSRPQAQGGDLFEFPVHPGGVNKTWLVTSVLESYDWSCVIVTLQNDS